MLCSNSSLYLTPPEKRTAKNSPENRRSGGPHQKAKISTHCLEVSRPFLCQKSTLGIRKNLPNWVYFRGPPKHPCWPSGQGPTDPYGRSSSWWFQPIWKTLVKIGSFPEFRDEKKISVGGIPNSKEVCICKVDINHHLFFALAVFGENHHPDLPQPKFEWQWLANSWPSTRSSLASSSKPFVEKAHPGPCSGTTPRNSLLPFFKGIINGSWWLINR